MTSTFVILAAGRGSRLGRIGDDLPKCLLPLNAKAALSHQLALAPYDAKIVVITGYRHEQVEEYVRLAHPHTDITCIYEADWGKGPGASLLMAKPEIEGDLIFAACDTLWEPNHDLWDGDASWLAVAPIPAGTPAARWCRAVPDDSNTYALEIHDKTPDVAPGSVASTAFARITADDLDTFWAGLNEADQIAGEIQLSSGLQAIIDSGRPLELRHIKWLDVGDEQAYRNAQAAYTGYDPLKPDQVTYVLINSRVVKFHTNPQKIQWRVERAKLLENIVPPIADTVGSTMMAYDFVNGPTMYEETEQTGSRNVESLLKWWGKNFWITRERFLDNPPVGVYSTAMKFYRDKTFNRVMTLERPLQSMALDAVTRINWDKLIDGVVPGTFHGDFTYANIIVRNGDDTPEFTAIDWREDFAGQTEWGDLRYDLAKLLSSTVFHWGNAHHGDFRRWIDAWLHRELISDYISDLDARLLPDIECIAGLCLINSAALHASPMDEILIARGCRWLGEVT